MHSFLKDGVSIVSMLDTRKPNNKGDYPIKIRVNHKRRREYYSIGISMSKANWEKLPTSKTAQSRDIKATIESSFSLVQHPKIVKEDVLRIAKHGNYVYAEVVFKKPKYQYTYCAGGNYITGDSNFRVLTGISYPIGVHDRAETWEAYNILSI